MRRLLGVIAPLIIPGICVAQSTGYSPTPQHTDQNQQTPQPSAPAGQTGGLRIAPGSVIPVQLTKTVDAKKMKAGDQVVARVTMDMRTQTGKVLVPKDTEVFGHITEAQARSKQEKGSQLGIAFDRAVLKDGGNVNLPMSIQAVIGPQNPENNASSEGSGQAPSTPSGGSSPSGGGGGGRSMGTGNTSASPAPPNAPPGDNGSTGSSGASTPRQPITANTQGVVGLSNLKLESSSDPKQGSVLSSEKNNVKLESGTMMLLRVNQ